MPVHGRASYPGSFSSLLLMTTLRVASVLAIIRIIYGKCLSKIIVRAKSLRWYTGRYPGNRLVRLHNKLFIVNEDVTGHRCLLKASRSNDLFDETIHLG